MVILDQQELGQLNIRVRIIEGKQQELTLLLLEKETFWRGLCEKYGLDAAGNYHIDQRGVVVKDANVDKGRPEQDSIRSPSEVCAEEIKV